MQEVKKTNIINQYSRKLLSFIREKTKSMEDAEDILQDVWYQFSRLANIDDLENIGAWLYSVSRNKITDLYRKKKSDSLEDFTYQDDEGNFDLKDILLLDETEHPDLVFFKELFWDEFNKAISELPENQKLVFIENELEDKTLQQIATEQGENLKTIISRKGYAAKHIRNKLLPLYNEFFKT